MSKSVPAGSTVSIKVPVSQADRLCGGLVAGGRYDAMKGGCVVGPMPPVVPPVMPALLGGNTVCDWTAPYVCNASQWSMFQGVSPSQFLTLDAPACGLGLGAPGGNLYW